MYNRSKLNIIILLYTRNLWQNIGIRKYLILPINLMSPVLIKFHLNYLLFYIFK